MKTKYMHYSSVVMTFCFISLMFEIYNFTYAEAILDYTRRAEITPDFGFYMFSMIYTGALLFMIFYGEKRIRVCGIIILILSLVKSYMSLRFGTVYIQMDSFVCTFMLIYTLGEVMANKVLYEKRIRNASRRVEETTRLP